MFRAFHQRKWRGAIGLIAAYALALQAFLTYSIASQAAAQGDQPYSGAFFVICASHDSTAAADGAGVPVQPTPHCPTCTLSVWSAATLPEPVSLPIVLSVRQFVAVAQSPFVFSQHATRPHSRGPPAIV